MGFEYSIKCSVDDAADIRDFLLTLPHFPGPNVRVSVTKPICMDALRMMDSARKRLSSSRRVASTSVTMVKGGIS